MGINYPVPSTQSLSGQVITNVNEYRTMLEGMGFSRKQITGFINATRALQRAGISAPYWWPAARP